ncbi:hypothetical protein EYF80_041453 [Liparis tanakae]|uniref:Uncharacterized protein n=1 Tax=Liparis tanakae TaxID=230148 RepID=A0A4Z2G5I8_9TELE|nr:hypothetical protein EYF80_041453 [Liparis tanakae]
MCNDDLPGVAGEQKLSALWGSQQNQFNGPLARWAAVSRTEAAPDPTLCVVEVFQALLPVHCEVLTLLYCRCILRICTDILSSFQDISLPVEGQHTCADATYNRSPKHHEDLWKVTGLDSWQNTLIGPMRLSGPLWVFIVDV